MIEREIRADVGVRTKRQTGVLVPDQHRCAHAARIAARDAQGMLDCALRSESQLVSFSAPTGLIGKSGRLRYGKGADCAESYSLPTLADRNSVIGTLCGRNWLVELLRSCPTSHGLWSQSACLSEFRRVARAAIAMHISRSTHSSPRAATTIPLLSHRQRGSGPSSGSMCNSWASVSSHATQRGQRPMRASSNRS